MQLIAPFGGSVRLSMNQVQAASLAEDGASISILRAEPANALNGELPKNGVLLELACHRRVAAGGVASGQELPFENYAARHTGQCQRFGS